MILFADASLVQDKKFVIAVINGVAEDRKVGFNFNISQSLIHRNSPLPKHENIRKLLSRQFE